MSSTILPMGRIVMLRSFHKIARKSKLPEEGKDMKERLRERLSIIPEYRHESYIEYKLSDRLIIIITSKNGTIMTDEKSYYISSLETSASELLDISRAHWGIESISESLIQWMLDADFSEDECSLLSENGQKPLNIFRKLALQLHKNYMAKQTKKRSIKSNLLRCLVSESALLELLRSL